MSKLSLNKSKKEEIPPTQDAFKDPIDTEDFDLSLPLTNISSAPKKEEDKTESDFSDVVSGAVRDLRTIMNSKLAIAKAREGLAYGLQEDGNIPPFCKILLDCRPDLLNRDCSKELVEIWTTKLKVTKTTLLTESVKFLDNKISDIDGEIAKKLANTKTIIGVATKCAGLARSDLAKRFLDMKERQEKDLAEFKTDIRAKQPIPTWKRSNIHFKKGNNRRGRPY
ncbi:unnamed protein product [Mytilus edulis]|uniref:Uncharacterized protein n=1 Tax=Mytilus edulis TaxID=6550 RepID=A0A8S3RWD2_MYTED|nr:unnamed protein product [Mytilus edulis]